MTRAQKLDLIWNRTPRDYRSEIGGQRAILVNRNGTTVVPLDDLTDEEISRRLPRQKR